MKTHPQAAYRLTLLWAFAESGLGGLLHGFKVPVTGFVLGAFAVVIISLIARIAEHPAKEIMQATLLVIAIKFAVSPHSPVPAYIAVLFQGALGAFLFHFNRSAVVVILFSVLALLESALQKPLVATLIFGKELWTALDELMIALGLMKQQGFSILFLSGYLLVYLCWAIFVGLWASLLPARLKKVVIHPATPQDIPVTQKSKYRYFFWIIAFLIFASIGLYVIKSNSPWLYILRTVTILLLVYVLLTPLLRKMIERWSSTQADRINQYYQELPRIKQHVRVAYSAAIHEKIWWLKPDRFVMTLLWITLYED